MSTPQAASSANGAGAGKKAVHVKWAGKTIALGTFPAAEADEKCARAKALTRAWRSTMRPKPSRDWVMLELERLGVRVVSGRLGRKAGEEEEGERKPGDMGQGPVPTANTMGWSSNAELDTLMQRRSSSLGLSMMSEKDINIRRGSLNSLGPALALESGGGDPAMPPHRPFVGGGSAAAYEAARADHYAQKREEQQRRASSLGLGIGSSNLGQGSTMPQMGLSVNPNQHYEMLKLHHMNLLNEIQETTLMMNLYQQQQLQQQQQQLQQQASAEGGSEKVSKLQQVGGNNASDAALSGGTSVGQKDSSNNEQSSSQGNNAETEEVRQAQEPSKADSAAPKTESNGGLQQELLKSQKEQQALEERLQKLREDIAKREKEAAELQKQADAQVSTVAAPTPQDASNGDSGVKREADSGADIEESKETKRIKVEAASDKVDDKN